MAKNRPEEGVLSYGLRQDRSIAGFWRGVFGEEITRMLQHGTKTARRMIMEPTSAATKAARISELPKRIREGVAQDFSTGLKMLAQKSNRQTRQKET